MPNTVTERDIRDYLNRKRIAHADLGYGYLLNGISLLTEDVVHRNAFKASEIYKIIARNHETSVECVERAIRASIQKGFKRSGHPNMHVTNKEFIACAYDDLLHGTYQTSNSLEVSVKEEI